MSLWKLFGLESPKLTGAARSPATAAETETVRKIVQALDRMPPELARHIAAFAYLLGRVANADQNVSEEEKRTMERIVMERGGVPEEQAILIVQIAKTQNLLFSGTENFLVSREFGKIASREQKLALLECLYGVCSADRSISVQEDNEVNRISTELGLTHEEFIEVRLKFRDQLAVLKK